MTYLLRVPGFNGARPVVYVADDLRVRYGDKFKKIGQAGPFATHEVAGHDKSRLRIVGMDAVDATGRNQKAVTAYAKNTAAGVKSVVRRLRLTEQEQIAGIDARIAEIETSLADARHERARLVGEAWAKANVVRLNELEVLS